MRTFLFNNLNNKRIHETAINKLRILKSVSKSNADDLNYKKTIIAKHKIEWHRKISLAFACIIMFLIGAPLGSIIRKGGFSVPLLVSILLFVVYYVISITGEKTAKDFRERFILPFNFKVEEPTKSDSFLSKLVDDGISLFSF